MFPPINSRSGPEVAREWLRGHERQIKYLALWLNLEPTWLHRLLRDKVRHPEWIKVRRVLDAIDEYPFGVPEEVIRGE